MRIRETIDLTMDFERVLHMVGVFFSGIDRPFGVIGAIGVAAHGFSRTTFDVDLVAHHDDQRELVGFLESNGFSSCRG